MHAGATGRQKRASRWGEELIHCYTQESRFVRIREYSSENQHPAASTKLLGSPILETAKLHEALNSNKQINKKYFIIPSLGPKVYMNRTYFGQYLEPGT